MCAEMLFPIDARGVKNVSAFNRCARLLLQGDIVVLPTETVYGIAADATNDEACTRIFRVKQRPNDNPLIVHCMDIEDALACFDAGEIYEENQIHKVHAYRCAKELLIHYAPGPLAVIAYANERVCRTARVYRNTIAVRVPSHPVFREIIQYVARPLAAPSANISGRPSATNAYMAYAELSNLVVAVFDGGNSHIGLESTIVDCTQNPPSVVRPGAITRDEIAAILTRMLKVNQKKSKNFLHLSPTKVPGAQYQHYKPYCQVHALDACSVSVLCATAQRLCKISMRLCVKFYNGFDDALKWNLYYKYENWDELAKDLYAKFVQAEKAHCEAVFVDMPAKFEHEALNNRIERASA